MSSLHDYLVYLELNGQSVHMVRTDGSEHQQLFQTYCENPDGVALDLSAFDRTGDPKDIVVWWGNMGLSTPCVEERDGADYHAPNASLIRAPLLGGDGSSKRLPLLPPADLRTPTGEKITAPQRLVTTAKQVQVTRDGRDLFFCDREGHTVRKYSLDTNEVIPLVCMDEVLQRHHDIPIKPNSDEDKMRYCVGIALDESRDYLFFTVKGPSKGGQGTIYAAPYHFATRNLSASQADANKGVEGVIPARDVSALRGNLPEPIDLLLDSKEGYLYWTDRGDDAKGGNSLNRATLHYNDLGKPVLGEVEVLITGFNEAIGLTWGARLEEQLSPARLQDTCKDDLRRYIYVTDIGGNIFRCDMKTRTKEAIHTGGAMTGIEFVRM